MAKTSIGWLELDALTAEPADVDTARYGFSIISGTPYYYNGSAWTAFATSGGSAVGTMNDTYENGRTIAIDSGAIELVDISTGALNILALSKDGAGTGNALDIDMNTGIGAGGIYIDDGAGARTGSDIKVKDDSTGTHSVINIDHSGSGAGTGYDWTNSYSGSDASFGVKLTFDNAAGLDGTGIQIVRGTGVRTAPAIDINEGSTGSANVIDIDISTAYTGDIIDIVTSAALTGNLIHLDLTSAVAATGLRINGSGTRTEAMVELLTSEDGAANMVTITPSGATWSGHVMQALMTAATTGDVLNIDMDAAVGGRAIYIDGGAAIRTAVLIDIKADGSGNAGAINIDETNTGSDPLIDVNVAGIGSAAVLDITYSAADTGDAIKITTADNVAGGALVIAGSGTRTDSLIDLVTTEDGSVDGVALISQTTNIFTGHLLTVSATGACTTGGLVHLNTGSSNVAGKVMTVDTAGARTGELFLFTLDHTFASGLGGTLFNIDISTLTGAAASPLIDIDITGGVHTGNIFDFATNQASTGTIFEINMTNAVAAKLNNYTLAGTRTVNAITVTAGATYAGATDIFQIDDAGTSSQHVFDVNMTGNSTGNVLDITMGTSKVAGDAIAIEMATDLSGRALFINRLTGNAQTAPLIYVANAGTDGGTDDHDLFIYQTGQLDSNMVQLTFATAASTGDAVGIAMGTNVAGRAIAITSSGTGVSGEGSALDITHDGILVAGADVVNITTSGAISSTSNALAIEMTGGVAGSYALYINAGNDSEAIHVDAGTVTFDETLTVTGQTTVGTIVYTALNDGTTTMTSTTLELNRIADLSSRLVAATGTLTASLAAHADRIINLDTAAGSTVTLPAASGTGAVLRFFVSALATSNSHIIKVANASDVMYGAIWLADSDTAGTTTAFVTAADSDTITLNRTTTGSVTIGEWIELVDIATNKWAVRGMLTNSGSGATPFSATV